MQQRQAAALEETALTFTGVIALGTCVCCTTMSCVALCIKLVSWIFGQRRPRRRLIRHTQEENDSRVPAYIPLDHHHHRHPNSNCVEECNADVHASTVELREIPFRNIEEPLESKGFFRSKRCSTLTVRNGADDNDRNPTANGLTSGARLKEFQDDERVSTHGDGDGDDDGDEEQDSGHGRLGG